MKEKTKRRTTAQSLKIGQLLSSECSMANPVQGRTLWFGHPSYHWGQSHPMLQKSNWGSAKCKPFSVPCMVNSDSSLDYSQGCPHHRPAPSRRCTSNHSAHPKHDTGNHVCLCVGRGAVARPVKSFCGPMCSSVRGHESQSTGSKYS